MMGGGYDAPFGSAAGWQDMEAILFQFSCNFTNPLTGNRIGFDVAMNDQDGEFQVFVHEGFPEDASPQGRSFAFSHQARFLSARVKRVSSRSPVQAEATEAAHLRPFRWPSCTRHVQQVLRRGHGVSGSAGARLAGGESA